MSPVSHASPGYFGKLPARGDFMKGGSSAPIIAKLDRWVSDCMNILADDPRWRIDFDNMPPVHFAFVAAHTPIAVAGHLQPSHDASHRRFPFLVATSVEAGEISVLETAPAAFGNLWKLFEIAVHAAKSSSDPCTDLRALALLDVPGEIGETARGYDRNNDLAPRTVGDADRVLDPTGTAGRFRRIVLALGLLLSPTLESGRYRAIDKSIGLPLPDEAAGREQLASIWQRLIAGFVSGSHREMQILQTVSAKRPVFIAGFNGPSPHPLAAAISPRVAAYALVSLDDPQWVEDQPALRAGRRLTKLSSYLADPATPIPIVLETFREVFLGDCP